MLHRYLCSKQANVKSVWLACRDLHSFVDDWRRMGALNWDAGPGMPRQQWVNPEGLPACLHGMRQTPDITTPLSFTQLQPIITLSA